MHFMFNNFLKKYYHHFSQQKQLSPDFSSRSQRVAVWLIKIKARSQAQIIFHKLSSRWRQKTPSSTSHIRIFSLNFPVCVRGRHFPRTILAGAISELHCFLEAISAITVQQFLRTYTKQAGHTTTGQTDAYDYCVRCSIFIPVKQAARLLFHY